LLLGRCGGGEGMDGMVDGVQSGAGRNVGRWGESGEYGIWDGGGTVEKSPQNWGKGVGGDEGR